MQQLWDEILHIIGLVVSPDWGSLVALIPLGVAAVVVLYMAWLVARLATAPPTRTGRRRLAPAPPPGTHLPGGSISPLLISLGAGVLLFGLVFRGPLLPLGVVALLLALLNWGREAMRDYQHVAGAEEVSGGSVLLAPPPQLPPGVHLPGPSFRPVLVSIAMAVVLLGLVFGPALLAAGVIMLLVTLFGWLRDARVEYRAVEEADRTGHLAAETVPGLPIGTLTLFAVLFVGAMAIHAGALPFAGGSAPAASPAPAASGGASAGPGGSGSSGAPGPSGSSGPPGASGGGGGQAAVLNITAQNIAFDTQSLTAPANTPITIDFTNSDQGVPHNVAIHKDSPTGAEVWKGDIITGPATATYNVPPLPAGTYGFVCSVHPNMTGTLTVK
jgi:plastocyanin